MTYRAEIEDNIPLPIDNKSVVRNRRRPWPFEDMTSGQSFVMNDLMLSIARWHCYQAKKAGFGKFFADNVVANGITVVRVWKI
jgi:hypothetical protein